MRVVSLIPAATEIVCAVGAGGDLVGRSHECDHPPGVESLPSCTEPKFRADGTSYGVDERVKALLREGLSVYRVDGERLDALAPDLILTQDHCDVCAASLEAVEEAVRSVVTSRPRVVSLSPRTLDDVLADVERVGRALELPERGRRVARSLRERMEEIAASVAGRWGGDGSGEGAARPTVALIEWLDPLMTAGNWMPTLVEMAGGRPVFGRAGAHSPETPWEDLLEADPDVLVVVPCGFDLDRTRRELPALTGREGWERLAAVRRGRIFLVDGHHFFNRPGPRLVESLEIVAELLHPGRVDFGHRGEGWIRAEGERPRRNVDPARGT